MNQTCRTLLEKQGRAHKWCSPMDPLTWPSKSRATSSNLHSPEDLPEVMNNREEWRERVRGICTGGTTRWWWLIILQYYLLIMLQKNQNWFHNLIIFWSYLQRFAKTALLNYIGCSAVNIYIQISKWLHHALTLFQHPVLCVISFRKDDKYSFLRIILYIKFFLCGFLKNSSI